MNGEVTARSLKDALAKTLLLALRPNEGEHSLNNCQQMMRQAGYTDVEINTAIDSLAERGLIVITVNQENSRSPMLRVGDEAAAASYVHRRSGATHGDN